MKTNSRKFFFSNISNEHGFSFKMNYILIDQKKCASATSYPTDSIKKVQTCKFV